MLRSGPAARVTLACVVGVELLASAFGLAMVRPDHNGASAHLERPAQAAHSPQVLPSLGASAMPRGTNAASGTSASGASSLPAAAQGQPLTVEGRATALTPGEEAELNDIGTAGTAGSARHPTDPSTEFRVEGRLSDGTIWRVTARRELGTHRICIENSDWAANPDGAGGGSGGGGCYDPAFDLTGGSGSQSRFAYLDGPVMTNATDVRLETTDHRVGQAFVYDAPKLGVRVWVAFIDCRVAVGRVTAVDASGHEVASKSPPPTPANWAKYCKQS